jgi:serine/threonine protein kinase/Flp pilus assembly protein TadD
MNRNDDTSDLAPICSACGGDLPSPDAICPNCMETAVGSIPAVDAEFTGPKRIGAYRILRELGSGGMGTVFEAFDERMQRNVALKILSRHHAPSEKVGLRFEQEAWIGGKLDHPNLVKVYERGEWEELSYYSMELIEGGSLHDVIGNMKRWGRDDRLGLEFGSREYLSWAITRIIAAARALDYSHRHGVVHRDIKPMNLLLGRESGEIKIADFGLAIDQDATRLTTAGKILGTLAYMAPEQLLGKQEEMDSRTDVYALGATLFELLTLELPFHGETQQLYMNAVLTSEARRPSKLNERVSRDLEIVIRKALEKDRLDRYSSAGEFADDLENVLQYRPIRARPPGRAERVRKWVRRKPVHAALLATLIVAAPVTIYLTSRAIQARQLIRSERIEELRDRIRLQGHQNDYRAILATAAEILHLDPDDQRALRSQAVTAAYLAGLSEDPADRAQLAQISRDAVSRLIRAAPESSEPHLLRAYVLTELGGEERTYEEQVREAETLAERFRSEEPSDDELHFDAWLAYQRGRYRRSVELLERLVARRPNRAGAIYDLAESYEALGEIDSAIGRYQLAAGMSPEDAVTRIKLGWLLTTQGRFEEGREHLRIARRLLPEEPAVYLNLANNSLGLGSRLIGSGEPNEALAQFRAAEKAARSSLELDDQAPWAHVNLGASLAEQYRCQDEADPQLMDEAIEHYERAFELGSRAGTGGSAAEEAHAASAANLCDAHLQMGNLERGLDFCRTNARLAPQDPVSFYNLAGVYALLGRADDAFDALEKDLELGDKDHAYLETDPWFQSLRNDPRFAELLGRMRAAAGQP